MLATVERPTRQPMSLVCLSWITTNSHVSACSLGRCVMALLVVEWADLNPVSEPLPQQTTVAEALSTSTRVRVPASSVSRTRKTAECLWQMAHVDVGA